MGSLDRDALEERRLRPASEYVNLIRVGDRVLADFLPQMIWIIRAMDRRLLYSNPSFQAFFGKIAPDWGTRSGRYHPDDVALIEQAFAAIARTGAAPNAEVRILDLEGMYRWHEMALVPVKADQGICEWVVTATDIDDRVQTRRMLQDTTDLLGLSQEAAGAGTWDFSLRDGKIKLSRESARLHGLGNDAVETDLNGWKRVVEPEDAARVLTTLQTAIKNRRTYSDEFRVRLADGNVRWLNGVGRAYYDETGEPVRMIGLNFDIGERKKAEADLLASRQVTEEARKQAELASTAKSDFLASMSHEIRTPLNSIIGYTDLLMEETEHGSPARRKLEVIQEAGSALLTIVNDVLDFSKIEAGQIDLDSIAFSPRALVDNVCSMLSGMAQRKNVQILRQIAAGVPHFVLGDESRLRQILLNLVNNAVKFTDHGFVAISVTRIGASGAPDIETIKFSVKDSGIGISAEKQKGLFQRFSQVDPSINRRFGGSGLGLAICRQLVDLMHGEIGVVSQEGNGATFWFKVALPVVDAPVDCNGPILPNWSTAAKSVRILLVEDVVVNQDLAKMVLERAGHVVDIASDGKQAVEAVRASTYDVVLMDMQMPVMDGIAATCAIRASDHASRSVPIIAMTANVLPQQVAGLKAAGMNDHVGKPFKRQELLAAIDRWASPKTTAEVPAVPADAQQASRFDAEAFNALEDLIGAASFRMLVAKLRAEFTVRLTNLSPSRDRLAMSADAHAVIQAAGSFGFKTLASLLRTLMDDPGARLEHLLQHIEAERVLVIADLDHYLASSGRPF